MESVRGADVVSSWAVGAGSWSIAANWLNAPSVAHYPNNGSGGLTYDAIISGGTLTLSENIALENLFIDTAQTTITGAGNLDVNGTLSLGQQLFLDASGPGSNALNARIVNGASGSTAFGVTKTGVGTWSLSGSSTFTGRTEVRGGVLVIDSVAPEGQASAIGAASDAAARVGQADAPLPNLVLDAGTLRYTGTGHQTNRHFALTPGGGTLDASGTGALVINNWWVVAHAGPDGARTLNLTGTNTDRNTLGLVITDYDFGYPGGNPNLPNPFGAATSLTKSGPGTWFIPPRLDNQPSGDVFRSYYTGPTHILGGTLEVSWMANGGSGSSIGASSAAASNLVLDGGTLRYFYNDVPGMPAHDAGQVDRLFSVGLGGGTIDSSGGGPLNLYNSGAIGLIGSGPRTLTLTGTYSDPTDGTINYSAINGVIGDNGGPTSIVKDGPGEWVFTNANTYSGATTVNNGTLLVAHGDNRMPATSALTIGPNGRFEIFTGDTSFALELISQWVSALNGAGTVALNAGTLVVNSTGASSYSGRIIDSNTGGIFQTGGNVAKLGAGELVLSGVNVYTGITSVYAGTLSVGLIADAGLASNIGASTAAPANLVLNGGSLRYTGGETSTNRGFTVGSSGATIDASGTGALALHGTISMPAGSGGRWVTLTGSNAGANAITGVISDPSGGVTGVDKTGPGRWVLGGANTYTGPTVIGAGTLQIGTGGTAGTPGGGAISNSAALVFNRSDTLSVPNLIQGTGAVYHAGTGTVIFAIDNSYTGETVIASGTLQLGGGGPVGSAGTGLISNSGALAFNRTGTASIPNVISGPGDMYKLGAGTTLLSGANTLTGRTIVMGGTLVAGHADAFGPAGRLETISGDARLEPQLTSAVKLASLSLATDTSIDVTDNALVIDGSVPTASVIQSIRAARHLGAWDRPGITSSLARTQAHGATTVGVLTGAEYSSVGGSGTFAGRAYVPTDSVVRYTWYGDSDLSGDILFDDYVRIDLGMHTGLTGWLNGDFDYSGVVDFDDYSLIDLAFNYQDGSLNRALSFLNGEDRRTHDLNTPALQQVLTHFGKFGTGYALSFLAAVPEPGSAAVAVCVGLVGGLAGRPKRRRRGPLSATMIADTR